MSKKRTIAMAGAVLVAAGGTWVYSRTQSEARRFHVEYNLHRTYRLEFYEASGWQRLIHPAMRDPGFIRLHDNCVAGRLVRTGPVVEFEGGGNAQVYWHESRSGTVGVGRDTRFDGVPPLSSDCRILKLEQKHGGG